MSGKKKQKVVAKKKASKKKTSNFKGRAPGAKNKPKPKVYRVLSPEAVLGDFATVDAARDAIRAQAALHLQLRTPEAPVEVSDDEITMMSEGESVAPEGPVMGGLMEFDWTIVERRQEPGDIVHPEW